jgi:hypothetical protein
MKEVVRGYPARRVDRHRFQQRQPHDLLGDLQAIEPAEILRLLLKECPLEAIVVGGKGTGECGHRIQPKSVECFDEKIKVAIGLRPDPLARMTEM